MKTIWLDWSDGHYTWGEDGVGTKVEVDAAFFSRLVEVGRMYYEMQRELQALSNAAYMLENPDDCRTAPGCELLEFPTADKARRAARRMSE